MTTAFTVTILSSATVDSTTLRVSVRIPEEAAPLVLNPDTGEEERDHGNADWPSDDEIANEVSRLAPTPSRSVTRAWTVEYVDTGDDLLEAIYEATLADADKLADQIGREWGQEMAGEPGALDDLPEQEEHVNDLKNLDFTILRETLEANGYTLDTDADDDRLDDGGKVIFWRGWQRLVERCCEAAHGYMADAAGGSDEDDGQPSSRQEREDFAQDDVYGYDT